MKIEMDTNSQTKVAVGVVLSIIAVIMIGWMWFSSYADDKAKEEYINDIKQANQTMLEQGVIAEKMVGLYSEAWHTGISEDTPFDMNEHITIMRTFMEDEDVFTEMDNIRVETEEKIRSLQDPPKDYEELYELIIQMYKKLDTFTELAIEPSGSYNSYTDETRELSKEIIDYSKEIKIKLPE